MTEHETDSELLHKGPCGECGSSDANATYSDGHAHCYSCSHYTPADGSKPITNAKPKAVSGLLEGESVALNSRRLSQETTNKFGYVVGTYNGKPVQAATYYDESGRAVAQKLRFRDKKDGMPWLGDKAAKTALYGQHLFKGGGKQVIVTEGELDALSVSQAFGNKWPAVSVPNGAQGAAKDVAKAIDWLSTFERVVFMFDMDDHGREAAVQCARLFKPGQAYIASLTEKDASDLLSKGKGGEITSAAWNAKAYRPDGIVTLDEIKEQAMTPQTAGSPWPWPGMTAASYGRHRGELITIGAGTGIGKTDFLTQVIAHTHTELRERCGVIFLEQGVDETAQRLAGKLAGKAFHVPDGSWSPDELGTAIDTLSDAGPLFLYDSWGALDWASVRAAIIYYAVANKCQHIFLDHLTALAALEENEKEALEKIMAELAGLAQQHNVTIYLVSHLSTPDGKSHEEGGRVTVRNFKGSRAIGYWSHQMIGLERDQQDDDEDARLTTTVRWLKHRKVGSCTGKTFRLRYEPTSGLLEEAGELAANDFGFSADNSQQTSEEDF